MNIKIKLLTLIIVLFSLVFNTTSVFSQTQTDKIAEQAELQRQLQELQGQIDDLQKQLSQTTAQKNTLANKIKALKKQQDVLNLQIKATNLQVTELGGKITDTENSISQNLEKSENLKVQMASIIRAINQHDANPFIFTIVSKKNLSEVFGVYQDFVQLNKGLSDIINQIKVTNTQLETEKQDLSEKQEEAKNLLSIKSLQQAQLLSSVSEQNQILQQTKGRELDYQITLNDTKARASEISGRIYQLLGISGQITFGEALVIAKWAQGATGINPAFLLAILTQESNLGKNVGTCNRLGDPESKSWKVIMKPERDQEPFKQITSELGMNPDITPVSCPMRDKNGKQVGWGGAMGPAQFIPSTWMGYKDKVAKLTGKSPANPWDIRDAFAASAIKLVAGGADSTYQGQWNAAMRYFSGSTNVRFRFYGDSVMNLTAKYEKDIADLNK